MPKTLPLDDKEPSPEAALLSPEMAQYHLWLAQAQRDHGRISDKEMAKVEGVASIPATRSRMLWNPFTGQFRSAEIADHYKSGAYLEISENGTTRQIA